MGSKARIVDKVAGQKISENLDRKESLSELGLQLGSAREKGPLLGEKFNGEWRREEPLGFLRTLRAYLEC